VRHATHGARQRPRRIAESGFFRRCQRVNGCLVCRALEGSEINLAMIAFGARRPCLERPFENIDTFRSRFPCFAPTNSLIGLLIFERGSEKKPTRAGRWARAQRANTSLEDVEFPAKITVSRQLRQRGVRWRLRAPPDSPARFSLPGPVRKFMRGVGHLAWLWGNSPPILCL
jgi:hypothetical protein